MKFEMEFNDKITEAEAYQKFCVNFVNQIRDKLNYQKVDKKYSIEIPVIRMKVKNIKPIVNKDKPKWGIGKGIQEVNKNG